MKLAHGFLPYLLAALCAGSPMPQSEDQDAEEAVRGHHADPDSCSSLPKSFTNEAMRGTKHGTYFCASKWRQGALLTSIEARAKGATCLNWIKFGFTDQSFLEYGKKPEGDNVESGKVNFKPWKDTFKTLLIYGGGYHDGIGGIRVQVNGQEDVLFVGMGSLFFGNRREEYKVDRGPLNSGIPIGFEGFSGDCINGLKPIFTQMPLEKVQMRNMVFDPSFEALNNMPFEKNMLKAVTSSMVAHNTRKDEEQLMRFRLAITTEKLQKLTYQDQSGFENGGEIGGTIGFSTSGQIGIPFLAEAEAGGKMEITGKFIRKDVTMHWKGNENTKSQKVESSYEVRTPVKPGLAARCYAIAIQSNVDVGYQGVMDIKLKGGESFSMPASGRFESAEASEAHTFCEDYDESSPQTVGSRLPNLGRLGESPPVATYSESGAYCSDGRKVGSPDMSEEEFLKACKV